MNVRKAKHGWIFTLVFTLISIAYVFPIALVVINSFKKKAYISKKPFAIPTDKMFVGIENYIKGIQRTGFIDAFFTSLFITVLSVGVIILCTSMCAWYIRRVKNRFTTALYADYEANLYYGCNPADDVDLERLSASVSCTGYDEV